jgi:hypothetical protein
MTRQKKIKTLHSQETKPEVAMSETAVLDSLQTEIDQARVELERTKKEIEEKKQELTRNPRREIEVSEKVSAEKQITRGNESAAKQKKIEELRDHDSVMVKGRFMNRRAPGQAVKLPYAKYATDSEKWWNFEDGQVYTIPRGFVDQINEYYHTPHFVKSDGPMDPNKPQSQIHAVETSNKKYAFVPIGF